MRRKILCSLLVLIVLLAETTYGTEITFSGTSTGSWQYHSFSLPKDSAISISQSGSCTEPNLSISPLGITDAESSSWYGPYPLAAGSWSAGITCKGAVGLPYTLSVRFEAATNDAEDIEPNNFYYAPQSLNIPPNGLSLTGHLGFWLNPGGQDKVDIFEGQLAAGTYSLSLSSDSSLDTETTNMAVVIKDKVSSANVFEDYFFVNDSTETLNIVNSGLYLLSVAGSFRAGTYPYGEYSLQLINQSLPFTRIVGMEYPENSVCGLVETFKVTLKNSGGTAEEGRLYFTVFLGTQLMRMFSEDYQLPPGGSEIKIFTWRIPKTALTGQYNIDVYTKPSTIGAQETISFIDMGVLCGGKAALSILSLLLDD